MVHSVVAADRGLRTLGIIQLLMDPAKRRVFRSHIFQDIRYLVVGEVAGLRIRRELVCRHWELPPEMTWVIVESLHNLSKMIANSRLLCKYPREQPCRAVSPERQPRPSLSIDFPCSLPPDANRLDGLWRGRHEKRLLGRRRWGHVA